jgi:hypothetical protein
MVSATNRRLLNEIRDGGGSKRILVVTKPGDELANEDFRRGRIDLAIATGVPRCGPQDRREWDNG